MFSRTAVAATAAASVGNIVSTLGRSVLLDQVHHHFPVGEQKQVNLYEYKYAREKLTRKNQISKTQSK